jgi:glycerophosphoryl diester phosphodiesterase
MIEIDIRKSRDNGLYVMHDKLTGRTAGKNIDIERATSDKIVRVKLKNNEPVPTLSDVLGLVAGTCGLNLEIKSSGAGALTAQYLLASGYKGHVLVSSFHEDEVTAARRAMPLLPTLMIFDVFTVRTIPSYLARGYSVVSLRTKTVNEELVAACHEQGLRVYVWTVDEEAEMRKFISWGVDGIYSNRPGVLKKIVEEIRDI